MAEPLYSVGTWDTEKQAYTPQRGLKMPSFNLTRMQLRQALKRLRQLGYPAHRLRDANGEHEENDFFVLVERTDGKPQQEILQAWER